MPVNGQRGTAPDGTEVIFQNGRAVPVNSTAKDMVLSGGQGLWEALTGALGTVGDLRDAGSNVTKALAEKFSPGTGGDAQAIFNGLMKHTFLRGPTSQDIQGLAESAHVVGQPYAPQTTAGAYTRTVGQFAPGLLMGPEGAGENMIGRAAKTGAMRAANTLGTSAIKNVLVPAAASETAGQITKGSKYEQAARLAAALTAGGATAMTTGAPKEASMVANATKGVSPQQMAAAVQRGQTAQSIGVPITMAEGVQSVAPNAGLGSIQKMVENSPQGAGLQAQFAQRPGQVQTAAGNVLDQIAPAGRPDMVSTQAQAAAESALLNLEKQRTVAVNPSYKAAGSVSPQDIQSLAADMRTEAKADQTGLIGPGLSEVADKLTPNGTPITDVQQLDIIRGHYRDLGKLPPGTPGSLDRRQWGAMSPYLDRLSNDGRTGLLDQDPNFVQGNQTYQDLSRSTVDPALAGPLGAIAGRGPNSAPTIASQGAALYPSAAPEGQAAVTAEAAQRLGGSAPDLTRAYLAQKLAENTQSNLTGENQWGGAKFAADVAGNQNQRAALMAGVGQAAPRAQQPLADLLDTLQATGTRQRMGSDTFANTHNAADVKGTVPIGILNPLEPAALMMRGTTEKINNLIGAGRRQNLANMLQMPPEQWISQAQGASDQLANGNIPVNIMQAALAQALASKTATQNSGGQ